MSTKIIQISGYRILVTAWPLPVDQMPASGNLLPLPIRGDRSDNLKITTKIYRLTITWLLLINKFFTQNDMYFQS